MVGKIDLKAPLLTAIAVICLLSACARDKSDDDERQREATNKSKLTATNRDAQPIRFRLEGFGQDQSLYAIVRPQKTSQGVDESPVIQIKLCTIGSQQELNMVFNLKNNVKGATLIRGELLQDKIPNANSSYIVTPGLPVGVEISNLTEQERAQLVASAYLISWPGEGELRSCKYNDPSERPSMPRKRVGTSRGSTKNPPAPKSDEQRDFFGTQN